MTDLTNTNTNTNINNNIVEIDEIDDIDETFDNKPVEVNLPELLSTDELNHIHGFLKGKSNKELSEIVTKILTKNTDENELQKMQLTSSIMKNLGTSSKRELLTTLDTILNSQNKYIVFESADKLNTITEEQKTSNDDLRKKLHQKIFMSNKKNQQKMYEKMMTQFQQSQNQTEPTNTETNIETNTETNTKSSDDKIKKKKKNKKNNTAFQQNIIDQMTSIVSQMK
jgi:hypothetical protein